MNIKTILSQSVTSAWQNLFPIVLFFLNTDSVEEREKSLKKKNAFCIKM